MLAHTNEQNDCIIDFANCKAFGWGGTLALTCVRSSFLAASTLLWMGALLAFGFLNFPGNSEGFGAEEFEY